jgi:peroxiredoxin family protein
MAKKLVIGLTSSCVDKLTAAGVIISGAAAEDMTIELFVLVNAGYAFKKENAENNDNVSELPHLKEKFFESLKNLNVPTWIDFFKRAKEFTEVKVYVCSLAGKIWGGEKTADFIDLVDDICGIGEYITAAEQADIHMLI